MNRHSSSLPDWYALTSPKYKVISEASIAAGLAAIYKDRIPYTNFNDWLHYSEYVGPYYDIEL